MGMDHLNHEINPYDEEQAFSLDGGKFYLAIQTSDGCYDYTIYHKDFTEYDGGQLDEPDWPISEAIHSILESFDLADLPRERYDYDTLIEAVTEVDLAQLSQIRAQHASLSETIGAAESKKRPRTNSSKVMEPEKHQRE